MILRIIVNDRLYQKKAFLYVKLKNWFTRNELNKFFNPYNEKDLPVKFIIIIFPI